jgi:hypothetical protein
MLLVPMPSLWRAVGLSMALALLSAGAAQAGLYPSFPGPGGSYLPPGMQMVVGMDGSTPCLIGGGDTSCVLPTSSSGGGGSGGAVTAAANSYALGSIIDLGTGSSPGANTVNGRLAAANTSLTSLITALGTPFQAPVSGTGSTSAVTVGASSAQVLAAGSRKYLSFDNESTTATIACNFGGTAAINTAGSYTLPPGATRTWAAANGFVPSDAVNCIASVGSTPLTVASN